MVACHLQVCSEQLSRTLWLPSGVHVPKIPPVPRPQAPSHRKWEGAATLALAHTDRVIPTRRIWRASPVLSLRQEAVCWSFGLRGLWVHGCAIKQRCRGELFRGYAGSWGLWIRECRQLVADYLARFVTGHRFWPSFHRCPLESQTG